MKIVENLIKSNKEIKETLKLIIEENQTLKQEIVFLNQEKTDIQVPEKKS